MRSRCNVVRRYTGTTLAGRHRFLTIYPQKGGVTSPASPPNSVILAMLQLMAGAGHIYPLTEESRNHPPREDEPYGENGYYSEEGKGHRYPMWLGRAPPGPRPARRDPQGYAPPQVPTCGKTES